MKREQSNSEIRKRKEEKILKLKRALGITFSPSSQMAQGPARGKI
jgi:hypothetical protein